jgi:anti-sigma B factor antagonist
MQLAVDRSGDVRILRVRETKLTYPNLSAFLAEVRRLIEEGTRKLVIDLQQVGYVDSATIGCLMDVRRLLQEQGGLLRLSGLQPRVETMISMTGVNRIIEVHREEAAAVAAFAGEDDDA